MIVEKGEGAIDVKAGVLVVSTRLGLGSFRPIAPRE
jgi:hypothetical protein